MKTYKEIGTLIAGYTYRIHIPAQVFPLSRGAIVEFNQCIKDYSILDRYEIMSEMTPYQIEKSIKDNVFPYRDEYGKVVLIKMKDEYGVELIEGEDTPSKESTLEEEFIRDLYNLTDEDVACIKGEREDA